MSQTHVCQEAFAQLGLSWKRPFEINDTISRTTLSLFSFFCRVLVHQLGNSEARKGIFGFVFAEGIGSGVLCPGL